MHFADKEKELIKHLQGGDGLRNYSCFLFLEKFKDLENFVSDQPKALRSKNDKQRLKLNFFLDLIKRKTNKYDTQFAYGNLYSDFLTVLEDVIESITTDNEFTKLSPFVNCVYKNKNQALEISELSVSQAIALLPNKKNLSKTTEKIITSFLDQGTKINNKKILNKVTPQKAGSTFNKLRSVLFPIFKPQLYTSMPSIRTYAFHDDNGFEVAAFQNKHTEIRMGTQAQIHNGKARVSPTFIMWLKNEAQLQSKNNVEHRIKHIYFNSLGLSRFNLMDVEGKRERSMSEALHSLETKFNNIAVITLPSDKGEMSHDMLSDHTPYITIEKLKERILNIALENGKGPKVNDFHLSEQVRNTIFKTYSGDPERSRKQQDILNELITRSFKKMGFNEPKTIISPAQQQAIYFDFIKFEFTNYIIQQLQPETVNFSCKDGIDRGGIASAYYNLILSIEKSKITGSEPMKEQEFTRALHAAPTLVKGRGMNNNIERLWNVINTYLDNQEHHVSIPKWLYHWRIDHAPSFSKYDIIKRLDAYMHTRKEEHFDLLARFAPEYPKNEAEALAQKNSIFTRFTSLEKIEAARKLKEKLINLKNGEWITENCFSKTELQALNDGRLKNIFSDVKKFGFFIEKKAEDSQTKNTPHF